MIQIVVTLRGNTMRQLEKVSKQERRTPADQAAVMLEKMLNEIRTAMPTAVANALEAPHTNE